MNCAQCGLPVTIPGAPRVEPSGGRIPDVFCCNGCLLVHRISGERGDAGLAQVLFGAVGAGLFLSMNVMMFSAPFYGASWSSTIIPPSFSTPIRFVLFALSAPVMVLLGYPLFTTAVSSIRRGRIGADLFVLIGAIAAFGISAVNTLRGRGDVYFETATMTLTLYMFGCYIETRVRARSSDSFHGLSELLPDTAMRIAAGGESREVAASSLLVGDCVLVRPGERVAVDGIVLDGTSRTDDSWITGESRRAVKHPGDRVYGGTLNDDGVLTVKIDRERSDFAAIRIERLLQTVREVPSGFERLADSLARWFMPAVLALALGALAYWIPRGGWADGIFRMLSILLIACPCAFGIAAPLAIWRGIGEAVKRGALILSADAFERLGCVQTVCFDKTGTITSPDLTLRRMVCLNGMSEPEILGVAAALEARSTHPLAASIARRADEAGAARVEIANVKVHPGCGVEGDSGGTRYALGSLRWLESRGVRGSESSGAEFGPAGDTRIYLAAGTQPVGMFVFEQAVRPEAQSALTALREMGIRTLVLTGDDPSAARALESVIPADEILAGLLPEQKVAELERRSASGCVAMVGDGINDAPAIKASTVGIAMGCGSDWSRQSARILLVRDDLSAIPELVRLSRAVRKKIYSNFAWAFVYNAFGIGLATAGVVTPLFAVCAMIASSVLVVVNSSRL